MSEKYIYEYSSGQYCPISFPEFIQKLIEESCIGITIYPSRDRITPRVELHFTEIEEVFPHYKRQIVCLEAKGRGAMSGKIAIYFMPDAGEWFKVEIKEFPSPVVIGSFTFEGMCSKIEIEGKRKFIIQNRPLIVN